VAKTGFHIPSLDGVRALSFGCVFLAHAGLPGVPGLFGVTVFFFLSGFLITTLLRRELTQAGRISLKNFYLRRVLRILPPFYLILASAAALSAYGVSGPHFLPSALEAQALHYANYWIAFRGFDGFPAGTGVYWSLAVEEHFYLLFPWLFVGLERLGVSNARKVGVLFGLCAISLAWRCFLVFGLGASPNRTSVASDTRFDSILFGCALALYENPMLDKTAISERVWKYVLTPLAGLVLLASFVVRGDAFRETFRYSLQGLALMPLFVCAMRYPSWWPMRVLNLRAVAFVGTLSYSLYLLHQVALACVANLNPTWGMAKVTLLSLLISFVLAFAIYQLIEKPCATLRRRLQA
jgi:peptidoglycan/LPS O-acetylase OafA/YrhL